MAEWKKVVVSGSSAALQALTVDGIISASSLQGNGANVLGVVSASHAATADTVTGTVVNATTASYILGSGVDGAVASATAASTATSASHAVNADAAVAATTATSASHAVNADAAVAATTATTATSASHAVNADAAVAATTATSASHAVNADAAVSATSATSAGQVANSLTVDDSTITLNTGTTYNGSAARTISVKNLGIATGKIAADAVTPAKASFIADATDVASDTNPKILSKNDSGEYTGVAPSGDVTMTQAGAFTIAADSVDGNKLTNNVTIANNLTVSNDLTVAGTASFTHSTNLAVADKYILLNSGSAGNKLDSGGIVIQGPTQDMGQLFGFLSGSASTDTNGRWAITSSFNSDTSGDFVPDAFMSTVVIKSDQDPNESWTGTDTYSKSGNIFVDTNGDGAIWIYNG